MVARNKDRKPLKNEYLCPFCFSRIDLSRIHYSCTNPLCAKRFLEGCSEADARRYRSQYRAGEEIDIENSVYLGKDPRDRDAVTTKNHIVRNSEDGLCDICHRAAYVRLCPVCHNQIPQGAEEEGSTIFAVMGSKGVGKSHYIAVLINQLRNSFSAEFGSTLSPASDRTTVKYRDDYYRRLFEEGRKLSSTPSYENNRESRDPMIYYLRFLKDDAPRVYTLAFFDTAGEDLDSTNKMVSLNISSFISSASGIVYLIDPLQIPFINKRIRMDNKPETAPDVNDRLSYISDIIRNKNKLRAKDPIDVPLAVVLTKVDVLMKSPENDEEDKVLFGPESSIHIERERGRYDKTNFDEISAEVEEYLRRTVSESFTQTVGQYTKHEYFAVSALGSNPSGSILTRGISPFRVEDPFIWLLNNCGGARKVGE
ncbi:hypothetical protein PAA26_07140 [Methanomassiliicoccaceae archaeon COG_1]|nr:hypothetical protein [Methanomassiliicoccaceae archaeon COG_1]